jgi:uncharacterized protein YndB with AHSA1/START domain
VSANDYHFVTDWRFEAPIDRVYHLISHPLDYPRWWPEVYLSVTEVAPGDAVGVGRVIDLHTRGRLPYTLRWQARTTEVSKPVHLALEATGDFVGGGVWTLWQDGTVTCVRFDWRIRADKPILRSLSWLLKPIFSANHEWAMARGEAALRRELSHG